MQIEQIREIVRRLIKEETDQFDDQCNIYNDGYNDGVTEVLNVLESEAEKEYKIIDLDTRDCFLLGGK